MSIEEVRHHQPIQVKTELIYIHPQSVLTQTQYSWLQQMQTPLKCELFYLFLEMFALLSIKPSPTRTQRTHMCECCS